MSVWIFQAVPEQYDIQQQVPKRIKTGDWWRVTRFRKEIRKSHTLLFWKAGVDAGIYATGEITSEVPFKVKGQWRVKIKYAPLLKKPILKTKLLKHRVLKNLNVLRQSRGSNFAVQPKEWAVLKKLLRDKSDDIPNKLIQSEQEIGAFDPRTARDAREYIQSAIIRRRGQPEFRQRMLQIFGGKCLVSDCDAEAALEAAHIFPYKGENTNHATNGLLLRSDLHTLFDLHLISIDSSKMKLLLAPILRGTSYTKFEGRQLNFSKTKPSKKALDLHRAEFERLRLSK